MKQRNTWMKLVENVCLVLLCVAVCMVWNLLRRDHAEEVGGAANEAEAFRFNLKAAEEGDGWGAYNAALGYREGEGTKQSPELAIQWMTAAWNRGILDAAYRLAYWLFEDEIQTKSGPEEVDEEAIDKAARWALRGLGTAFEAAGEDYMANLAKSGWWGDDGARKELWVRLLGTHEKYDGMPDEMTREDMCAVLLADLLLRGAIRDVEMWAILELGMGGAQDERVKDWLTAKKPDGLETSGVTYGDFLRFMLQNGMEDLNLAVTLFGKDSDSVFEIKAAKERMAGNGDWRAAVDLGEFWEQDGFLLADGLEEARWRLATSWVAHSQYRLGCLYGRGNGVREDAELQATWWFAQCVETDGMDAMAANNALLFHWLEGKPLWWMSADGEASLVEPDSEAWSEVGAELSQRTEGEAEADRKAIFARILLCANALRHEDVAKAREWADQLPAALSEVVLGAWEAVEAGGTEEYDALAKGVCAMLGAGGPVDWTEAMDAFLAVAENDVGAARLACLLAQCEWWQGRDEALAADLAESWGEKGDSWMAEAAADFAWQDCLAKGNLEGLRAAVEPWIEWFEDKKKGAAMLAASDLLGGWGAKTYEIMAEPLSLGKIKEFDMLMEEFNGAITELKARFDETDVELNGQREEEAAE